MRQEVEGVQAVRGFVDERGAAVQLASRRLIDREQVARTFAGVVVYASGESYDS
jgi:hypothetical protein